MTRSAPLAVVLCVQACLLFCALDLLPVWTDELFTLTTVAHPVAEIIPIVQRDIHPPLYYILLHGWAKLPLPWTMVAALRAFSVLWALLATFLFDWFWLRSAPPFVRWLALTLFACSPCLLLYGRMARSYSMQVAVALIAVAMLQKWMREPKSIAPAAIALAATLGLLYTHYLPGMAVIAGFALIGWRRVGDRAAIFLAAVTVGYSPWLITLSVAIGRWREASAFSSQYLLTGNPVVEQVLKIGYGVVSLAIGESFWAISLLLAPVIVILAIAGARRPEFSSDLAAILAGAAVIGYLGVARWVSYAFIPARLLWLLPFVSLAVALGIANMKSLHARRIVTVVIVLSYLSSDVLYFRRENFLNLGYIAPLREISDTLNRDAKPNDLILVDSFNTDFQALGIYLSGRTPMIAIDRSVAAEARRKMAKAGTVWIVRNTRDISPGAITPQLWHEACTGRSERDTLLEPYAPWQKLALHIAGFQPPPTHFYELIECGKD